MAWNDSLARRYSLVLSKQIMRDSKFSESMTQRAAANGRTMYQEIAKQSYDMADAMIAESAKRATTQDDDIPL